MLPLKYVSTFTVPFFRSLHPFARALPHRCLHLPRPITYRIRDSPKLSPEEFPPLPEINDAEIEKQVFTHRSLFGRSATVFEDVDDGFYPDNETLEFLGDSVVGLITTELLREMYPRLRVGPLTKIKSLLVSNANLAVICTHYGLQNKLRGAPSQILVLKQSEGVQGDLFESYVGGLFLTKGMEVPRTWFRTIIRPFAEEAIAKVRQDYEIDPPSLLENGDAAADATGVSSTIAPPPPSDVPDSAVLGLFNQHCEKKNMRPIWEFGPMIGSKTTPIWTVDLLLGDGYRVEGRGIKKQAAKAHAAQKALQHFGVSY